MKWNTGNLREKNTNFQSLTNPNRNKKKNPKLKQFKTNWLEPYSSKL